MTAMPQARRARGRSLPVSQGPLLIAMIAMMVLVILGPLMTYSDTPLLGDGNPVRQGAYALVFLLVLIGIRPFSGPERLLSVPLMVILALGWCWISLSWAIAPMIAIRRLVLTSMVIWIIFTLVKQLGYLRCVAIMRIALVVALVASYVAVLVAPTFAIHQYAEPGDPGLIGNWRGIMAHKNFAGMLCAITAIMFAFDARRIPGWARAIVILASIVFLVMSESKTSLGIGAAALVVGFLFTRYSAFYRGLLLVLVWGAGTVAALLVVLYKDPISGGLSDPRNFTGRPAIWTSLWSYIGDHPLLGAGYGSFWDIGPESPIHEYSTASWINGLTSAHNGLLDLTTQIGLPGLALVLVAVVVWPLWRLFSDPAGLGQRGALIAGLLFFTIGYNATESGLFDRDTVDNAFLMLAIALIGPAGIRSVAAPTQTAERPARPRLRTRPYGARA